MTTTAPVDEVYRVIHTDHHDPFQILGMHPVTVKGKPGLAIRAFLPDSEKVSLVPEPDAKLTEEVELRVQGGAIVIARIITPRSGWADAARKMRQREDDRLLDPLIPTRFDDEEWEW